MEAISLILSLLSIAITAIFGWLAYKLSRKQGEIIDRLNIFQTATAETQLREKITVMKQRVKKFRHKPEIGDKYNEDEVVLLIGDCMAGLPLFELAPTKTRNEFVETTCEAMTSLDSEYIDDREKHKKKLKRILAEHSATLSKKDKPEIAVQFDSLLERCGVSGEERLSLTP